MNRQTLSRIGVPEKYFNALLDEWSRDLARESVRLAVQTLKETENELPQESKATFRATLTVLTPEIAAHKVGCSRKTIDRAIEAGSITAIRGTTGRVILDRNSLEAWAKSRTPAVQNVQHIEHQYERGLRN